MRHHDGHRMNPASDTSKRAEARVPAFNALQRVLYGSSGFQPARAYWVFATVRRLCVLLLALAVVPTTHVQAAPACPEGGRACNVGERAPLPTGGFIEREGAVLTRLGQPVQLKGVNYYPQWRPWADMWWDWDATQIARELRQARRELGINAVRVLVPYNITGARDGLGVITPELLGQLRELAQIAGDNDMRLLVTLFDFYHNFEQPGTPAFARDIAYVRALVGAFKDDERILGWDVHNEPDHYGAWGDRRSEVQHWLGLLADEIHAVAPKQLVTVGMGQAENLWLPGPDGRSALDYSDFVSVHVYDAGAAVQQLDELRRRTDKPLVVEEFGWPSDPPCLAANYDEGTQAYAYRTILSAARGRTSGVFAWTLRDYDHARTGRWDSREEHFGLYRADGTRKPAAAIFRAERVAPLPSDDHTRLPLTNTSTGFPNDQYAPLPITGTPYHVKGQFRIAWERLGGQASFGLPLGDAFQRHDQRRVIQHFERAVLELNLDAERPATYDQMSDVEQAQVWLTPRAIGRAALGPGGEPTTVAARFQEFYTRIGGEWRLGRAISPLAASQSTGVEVQFFERGRLEWAAERGVSVSDLGVQARAVECAAMLY
ncbi:MAG: cellulase family glycosylhydrolase [Roseiflexaceae bacterium]|nr:cellulase family glycosylhydrolase [Roseiflexaceae bacterium]